MQRDHSSMTLSSAKLNISIKSKSWQTFMVQRFCSKMDPCTVQQITFRPGRNLLYFNFLQLSKCVPLIYSVTRERKSSHYTYTESHIFHFFNVTASGGLYSYKCSVFSTLREPSEKRKDLQALT